MIDNAAKDAMSGLINTVDRWSIIVGMLEATVMNMQAEAAKQKGKVPMGGEPDVIDELLTRIVGNVEQEQGGCEDSEEEEIGS